MTDQETIRAFFPAWLKASLEEDVSALRELLAEDVIFLTASMPPIIGREAFLALATGAPKPFDMQFEQEIKEVNVSGDWAQTWTHLTVTVIPAQGAEPVRRGGEILSLFQKQPDGRWVLKRDANMLKVLKQGES